MKQITKNSLSSGKTGRYRNNNRSLNEKVLFSFILLSFILSLIILFIFSRFGAQFNKVSIEDYVVGRVAFNTVIADRNIDYIDANATEAAMEKAIQEKSSQVFVLDQQVTEGIISRYKQFNVFIRQQLKTAKDRTAVSEAVKKQYPHLFSDSEIRILVTHKNLSGILELAQSVLTEILNKGVIRLPKNYQELSPSENILIKHWNNSIKPQEQIPLADVITREKIDKNFIPFTEAKIAEGDIAAVQILLTAFVEDNGFYNEPATARDRERILKKVAPVKGVIKKGDEIIVKGDTITPEHLMKLNALATKKSKIDPFKMLAMGAFLLILYAVGFILLSPPITRRRIKANRVYLLLGFWLFYLTWGISIFVFVTASDWLVYSALLPTALIAMFVAILEDSRVSIIFSLLLSASLFLLAELTETSSYSFLFAFLSSIAAAKVASGSEKRIDLIRASLLLSLFNAVFLFVLGLFQSLDPGQFLLSIGLGALNGFLCGILTLGLLPIFEHMLNVPTVFRLMELSDLNSPIIKRMLTLASGTYGHSLSVANLAESACREIGANALLARVGAYYHDIGKIDQAEYFVENQTANNKHDELKPSLSAAVIKSHVKIGVEKAKELGLPKEVINIIAQHHGSGLISYFYTQALKSDPVAKINPDDFSYSESKPTSKEAAVVMLADTIEAATRTLKKPTVVKLEKFIWETMLEKFTSGQMNESDLTFKDLEIIKKTFVQLLAGHFHSRIEYPKLEEAVK